MKWLKAPALKPHGQGLNPDSMDDMHDVGKLFSFSVSVSSFLEE